MRIEDRLFLVKHLPDVSSHIKICSQLECRKCQERCCLYVCPAGVYGWDEGLEEVTVSYEGCFECGACRLTCPRKNIEWRMPRGGLGVAYRYG